MKSVLASLPASFHADRAELLDLILRKGILHRSPEQPICSPDGTTGRWMLNSLAVTLETRGAELAGRCLLPLLDRFDGRQLATFGLIGVPILQSCILQSAGRYRGLLLRKEAKAYGAMRLIEGEIDPNEPVIVVDDSIASGTTFWQACKRLEDAGLLVEGGVCLVRFGWPFGVADAQQRGFHMESVFDLYDDLMAKMEGEEKPIPNPSKVFPDFHWGSQSAPEGLHPATLARTALLEYLEMGTLPRPPEQLDQEYDSSGGAWVSLRSKSDIYNRHARDGFWHFPGEPRWSTSEAVLRAVLLTAQKLPRSAEGCALVDSSHIAVTFFSALEECTVGEIDNDQHGIVASSRERTGVMGGALPRMPGFGDERRLFDHARLTNGKLLSFEPFTIHRHGVAKFVEPGAPWQPTGIPAPTTLPPWLDELVCDPIASRARDLALHELLGTEERTNLLRPEMLPESLDLLFVTVYVWGQLRGCAGFSVEDLGGDLRGVMRSALEDIRFEHVDIDRDCPEAVAVSVTFLYSGANMGQAAPEEVHRYLVRGRQALQVSQGQRSGLIFPFLAAMHSLTPEEYVAEVIDKAGITRPPYCWQRFDCATWLADADGVGLLEGAFKTLPAGSNDADLLRELAELYSNYLLRHHRGDGTFYESYEPFKNLLLTGGNVPRLAHGGWVLMRAWRKLDDLRLKEAAENTLKRLLSSVRLSESAVWLEAGSDAPSVSEIAFLILALCELPAGDYRRVHSRGLADSLWSSIDRHGRVTTHFLHNPTDDILQDYFPGQVLLALAVAVQQGLTEVDEVKLQLAFRCYRRRFRYQRSFGQASWMMQAFCAWWKQTQKREFAELVFEIGDWILQYQQEKTGAFLSDDQPGSIGYTSAIYLEGIGAASRLAEASGDFEQHQRLSAAYFRGLRFLHRITIHAGHAYVLPNTDLAVGGLRMSIYDSFVRTDFVQHGLSSVLELCPDRATQASIPKRETEAMETTV